MLTSTASNLKCPRCDVALFEGKTETFALLGCGKCGGVWLTNAAAIAVTTRRVPDAAKLAEMVGATGTPDVAAVARTIVCPECAKQLTRVTRGDVRIDVCEAHGTWFDKDELKQVMEHAAEQRTELSRPESGAGAPVDAKFEYPWLARLGALYKLFAFLVLVVGVIALAGELSPLWADKPYGGPKPTVNITALLTTVLWTVIATITMLGFSDAAKLLLDLSNRKRP